MKDNKYLEGGLNTKPINYDNTWNDCMREYVLSADITKLLLDTKDIYKKYMLSFTLPDFSDFKNKKIDMS